MSCRAKLKLFPTDIDRSIIGYKWHDGEIVSVVAAYPSHTSNAIYRVKADDGWQGYAFEEELELMDGSTLPALI